MKRLRIELENLKNKNGRIIALPTILVAIDTEDKEFGFYCLFMVCFYSKILLWTRFGL